jgi:hypothetical protein
MLSLACAAGIDLAFDDTRLRAVVAYKKDLFRPQLINLLISGDGFEHELAEITAEQGLAITRALAAVRPSTVDFDVWWREVTDPLHRQGDVRVV